MRVAVISTNIFELPVKGYSGLEHLAWLIAKGLADKGHDVTLIAPKGSTCPGVTIHETNLKESEALAFLGYEAKLNDYDVVIDHSWQKWSVVGRLEGTVKVPVLCVCHAPIATMYSVPPGLPKPCFVGISKDHAQSIREHLKIDARCAYNGVDMDFYRPAKLKRNSRYLFLARFSSIKGADIACRSCLEAQKPLDLVGDTEITNEPGYRQEIEEACKNNPTLLKFIGPQSREQTVTWFSTSKCLLHPVQRFREPFGLSPCESQSCSCPVIAWRNGAMPETILHGETGFLVDSEAELTELLKTDAVRSIKPERCREWAEQFSVPNMITRYEELCEEAFNGGW